MDAQCENVVFFSIILSKCELAKIRRDRKAHSLVFGDGQKLTGFSEASNVDAMGLREILSVGDKIESINGIPCEGENENWITRTLQQGLNSNTHDLTLSFSRRRAWDIPFHERLLMREVIRNELTSIGMEVSCGTVSRNAKILEYIFYMTENSAANYQDLSLIRERIVKSFGLRTRFYPCTLAPLPTETPSSEVPSTPPPRIPTSLQPISSINQAASPPPLVLNPASPQSLSSHFSDLSPLPHSVSSYYHHDRHTSNDNMWRGSMNDNLNVNHRNRIDDTKNSENDDWLLSARVKPLKLTKPDSLKFDDVHNETDGYTVSMRNDSPKQHLRENSNDYAHFQEFSEPSCDKNDDLFQMEENHTLQSPTSCVRISESAEGKHGDAKVQMMSSSKVYIKSISQNDCVALSSSACSPPPRDLGSSDEPKNHSRPKKRVHFAPELEQRVNSFDENHRRVHSFSSILEASESLGLKVSEIRSACDCGTTFGGLTFRYLDPSKCLCPVPGCYKEFSIAHGINVAMGNHIPKQHNLHQCRDLDLSEFGLVGCEVCGIILTSKRKHPLTIKRHKCHGVVCQGSFRKQDDDDESTDHEVQLDAATTKMSLEDMEGRTSYKANEGNDYLKERENDSYNGTPSFQDLSHSTDGKDNNNNKNNDNIIIKSKNSDHLIVTINEKDAVNMRNKIQETRSLNEDEHNEEGGNITNMETITSSDHPPLARTSMCITEDDATISPLSSNSPQSPLSLSKEYEDNTDFEDGDTVIDFLLTEPTQAIIKDRKTETLHPSPPATKSKVSKRKIRSKEVTLCTLQNHITHHKLSSKPKVTPSTTDQKAREELKSIISGIVRKVPKSSFGLNDQDFEAQARGLAENISIGSSVILLHENYYISNYLYILDMD